MKKIISKFLALSFTISLFAMDGKEIVQKALDVKDPAFTQSAVQMDLIEKNGAKETRLVRQYGRSKDGIKAVVMVFLSPASVKDTRFLLQENKGNSPDDKFIYLPDLRSTRRVSTAEGSKSFMGTDASYDDLSTRDIDVDTHELLKEETKNGFNCYVVKSKAINPSDSQYGWRIQWIDKETWVPVYAELYDKKGELLKVLTVEKLEKITGESGQSYDIPTLNSMKNVQTGHETKLEIKKIVVDKPIPDRVFTQNFLNTGK
ncbi:outer membrane lipoprotein-sorting protein [Treponema pectinovorum]|uniref:outer membrane lipoprotein-sorting protein n=1 Tax=Treponema pectinovorum TaxID=164 RepID=UPI0011F0F56A|nr:outer membrane lipoprotein-sorting protein [Treponema pectinovorum]